MIYSNCTRITKKQFLTIYISVYYNQHKIKMTSEEKIETKEKKQIKRDDKGNIIEEKYEAKTESKEQ